MANRLINEQSPYLLQHAHNPVDWHPWGDEAFEKAKTENKPVLVSIGYAACHWCHVMEHESFEDPVVAAYMNEHFVCIKVDREEHPDVDHLYMDAVQAIGGNGGWPLNVFAMPDRTPFYGGTYYPPRPAYNRPSWSQLLQRMREIWDDQHEEVVHQALQMVTHLRQASQRTFAAAKDFDAATCRTIADTLLQMADKEKGGFGNAPKFPGSMAIRFLLEHYHFTGYQPALDQALRSLDAMIEGGIYDQLGGGFARYATDRDWLIPHFEKMLYDNALLIPALCDAWRITRDERYLKTVRETIAFAERELTHTSGGYYCALDADSEGVEGKFYTWTWAEWQEHAGDDPGMAAMYFGVSPAGNWEEVNILHVASPISDVAAAHQVTEEIVRTHIDAVKERLLAVREARIRPQTDNKCLLAWNAMMNTALSHAAATFAAAEPGMANRYKARAVAHMNWMLQAYYATGELLHTWKDGVARIGAKIDDYAQLVQALLQLGSLTGDNAHIALAAQLIGQVQEAFAREDGFFYFTPAHQQDIPVRKVDVYDGATPSANAVMAHNLWLAGMAMENTAWLEQAWAMLRHMSSTAMRYSYSFGYWAMLLQRYVVGGRSVVCTGDGAEDARDALLVGFNPQIWVLTSQKEISDLPILSGKQVSGGLLIFVCTDQACLPPVKSVAEVVDLLHHQKYHL